MLCSDWFISQTRSLRQAVISRSLDFIFKSLVWMFSLSRLPNLSGQTSNLCWQPEQEFNVFFLLLLLFQVYTTLSRAKNAAADWRWGKTESLCLSLVFGGDRNDQWECVCARSEQPGSFLLVVMSVEPSYRLTVWFASNLLNPHHPDLLLYIQVQIQLHWWRSSCLLTCACRWTQVPV